MTVFLTLDTIGSVKDIPAIESILASVDGKDIILYPEDMDFETADKKIYYSLKDLYTFSGDGSAIYPDTVFKRVKEIKVKEVNFFLGAETKFNVSTAGVIILSCGRFVYSNITEESILKLSSIGLFAWLHILKKIFYYLAIGIISFTLWRLPHLLKTLQPALYEWLFVTNKNIPEAFFNLCIILGFFLLIWSCLMRTLWMLKERYAETLFLSGRL